MKKISTILTVIATLALSSCENVEDFSFKGTVIGYEICTSYQDLGYLVDLEYPENIGGEFTTSGETFDNVLVVYQAHYQLKNRETISGTIYLEENFAKSYCNRTYTDRDVPEAVFTSLKLED